MLQSCLSKITLIRERELDRARKYFEMLYMSFDVSGGSVLTREGIVLRCFISGGG